MGDGSKIEWTDATWNPVRGCSIVSKGCTNCYAMRQAHRSNLPGGAYEGLTQISKGGPVWSGRVRLVPELLDAPLRWRKPRRIFVNSMSDLFHDGVQDDFILRVFDVMLQSENGYAVERNRLMQSHTFQILTKRPARMLDFCRRLRFNDNGLFLAKELHHNGFNPMRALHHVWLGVSVEDQASADERIPLLLQTPAAVRWISAEPLLGPIDLRDAQNDMGEPRFSYLTRIDGKGPRIDWVVAGGESGPGARPSHPDWFRSLREQCSRADVPFFFKQWGAWKQVKTADALCSPRRGMLIDGAGRTPPVEAIGKLVQGEPDPRLFIGRVHMKLIGKKRAGRILDGRTHDEYPSSANHGGLAT